MKEKREPRYVALDLRSYRGVMRLKPRKRLEFFDRLFEIFNEISNDNLQNNYENDLLGDLLRDASKTMLDVYIGWQRRAFANPSGLPKQSTNEPIGGANGADIISSHSTSYNPNSSINQIKAELQSQGYKESEINDVLSHTNGIDKNGNPIKDLTRYVKQAIDANRSKNRLPIQNYQQRSYVGEQEKAIERMMNDTWGNENE